MNSPRKVIHQKTFTEDIEGFEQDLKEFLHNSIVGIFHEEVIKYLSMLDGGVIKQSSLAFKE